MATLFCAIWSSVALILISTNPTLSRVSEKIDVFPSEISNARYILLIVCCFTVPIGWILSNVFLELYFKFDQGYFSVVNIQFHYKKGAILRGPIRQWCREKINSIACCNCCKKDLLKPALMGDWVDLSGQADTKNDYSVEGDDSEIENLLNLDESDKIIFDQIKTSIPYYRKHM